MLVAYPLRYGASVYDKAWGWTVYLVQGVWRCLRENKLNIVPRFLFIPMLFSNVKFGDGCDTTIINQ